MARVEKKISGIIYCPGSVVPEHNEFFFYIQIATLGIAIVNSDSDTGFPTVKRVSLEAAIGFRDGPVHFNHAAVESALLLRITSAPSGLPGDGGRRHGAG